MELMTARGVQDLAPEQKIMQQELIDRIKTIFERFGYSPLETPIIERYDVLSSKYAGGTEILKETFKLQDQGGRELCLRYDLTVPFSRFVGMNKNLKMPFKRYQIDKVFRDGPLKLGRMREFWQCDVDLVGSKSMKADAEMLLIAQAVFKELDLDVILKVNNRKVLNAMLSYAEIEAADQESAILSIDKLAKIGADGVRTEFQGKGFSDENVAKILFLLDKNNELRTNEEKFRFLAETLTTEEGREGLKEIEELFSYLKDTAQNRSGAIVFDLSLARGLSYYTNTVFEAYLADGSFASSLAGGGRYNEIILRFLESEDPQSFPAVGISFGLEPISVVMQEQKKNERKKTVTQVYVIPIGVEQEAMRVAQQLRSQGLNVDLDLVGRGVSKNLQYVDSYQIPFALFVGKEELAKGQFKLKNMKTGEEIVCALDKVGSKVRSGK